MSERVSIDDIRNMTLAAKMKLYKQAARLERPIKLYLHWTAGHYYQVDDEEIPELAGYHILISGDGDYYVTTENLSDILEHTWKRNTGSIGIALACCAGATSEDLGDEPPTAEQIESLAEVTAVICDTLDLPIDIHHVMTHSEAADNLDGYDGAYGEDDLYGPDNGCERWDLAIITNDDEWKSGGDKIREKARSYSRRG